MAAALAQRGVKAFGRDVDDLLPLARLSDAMQDDIGLATSLRARVQLLREREALWLRF